jgi:hypothetical protein
VLEGLEGLEGLVVPDVLDVPEALVVLELLAVLPSACETVAHATSTNAAASLMTRAHRVMRDAPCPARAMPADSTQTPRETHD